MFFTYDQNNSGGGFDHDPVKGIAEYVVIEADSAEEANEKAEAIGLYFDGDGDCECCGNRWYPAFEDDGTFGPTVAGRDALTTTNLSIFPRPPGETLVVHFADGSMQWDGETDGVR